MNINMQQPLVYLTERFYPTAQSCRIAKKKEIVTYDCTILPMQSVCLNNATQSDLQMLKSKLKIKQQIVAFLENPTVDYTNDLLIGFEFCGYDVCESLTATSAITNCGYDKVISYDQLNDYGLVDNLSVAQQIQQQLTQGSANQSQTRYSVFAAWRYINASDTAPFADWENLSQYLDEIRFAIIQTSDKESNSSARILLKKLFEDAIQYKTTDDYYVFVPFCHYLSSILDASKGRTYYPQILYMTSYAHYAAEWFSDAEKYAKQYYRLCDDRCAACLLLAKILLGDNEKRRFKLAKASRLIDKYLADFGDPILGLSVKIDILIRQNKLQQAKQLLDNCYTLYPQQCSVWDYSLVNYYERTNQSEAALSVIARQLSTETARNTRNDLFYQALGLADTCGEERALEFVTEHVANHPNDSLAILYLARLQKNDIDTSIDMYEKVYSQEPDWRVLTMELLYAYAERATENDAVKFLKVIDNKLPEDSLQSLRSLAKLVIYGKIGKYDRGQSIRLLEKAVADEPDDDCNITLLGKAYEYAIGTDKDAEKAFELYKYAYRYVNNGCKCGMLFYSYALYFGIGTRVDKKTALDIIAETGVKRGEDDCDYSCLYAIAAFENEDLRFSKNKAIRLLKQFADVNACSALLLYRYSTDSSIKDFYRQHFAMLYEQASYLEQQHLNTIYHNPESDFVPFIHN